MKCVLVLDSGHAGGAAPRNDDVTFKLSHYRLARLMVSPIGDVL